jgi:dipeptidyl aminopeptidase/acylaminoacyl peptidase
MPEPLSAEALVYAFRRAGDPRISPDGLHVVYTLTEADPETKKESTQLWLCDTDGDSRRQITHDGRTNRGARWSPDGSRIAFTSDRVEDYGIFVMSLAGGDPEEVTRHRQAIADLAWSPDGTQLAYVTDFDRDDPDEEPQDDQDSPPVRVTSRLDYKVDGLGYRGDKRKQVFVVDVESGSRRRLTGDVQDYASPVWSPDGTIVSAQRSVPDGDGLQLALIGAASGSMTLVGPEGGVVDQWAWSQDGGQLLLDIDQDHSYQSDIRVFDLASGEARTVLEDLDWNPGGKPGIGMLAPPVWLDAARVLIPGVHRGGTVVHVVDVSSGDLRRIHQSESTPGILTVDGAGTKAVREFTSFDAWGEIEVIDLATGGTRLITDYSDEVCRTHPAARWERLEIDREGWMVDGWMLKPPDFRPSETYPVVLDIHGGPNSYYGYDFNPYHQLLATNGYIVVYANPRGSSSYGRDFARAVFTDWGGEDYRDLMAVLDAALERPYCDVDRQGVRGYSYGGYMTAWIIGQTDRFRAAVCGAPCFDLESFWGTSDIGARFGGRQFGGPAHEIPEWYAQHSPSNHAHRATTPTLIIHGESDERCPIGQGEQMFVALKQAGVEVEFARYPGGSHLFFLTGPPEHRVDALERTLAWFDRYLKAEA